MNKNLKSILLHKNLKVENQKNLKVITVVPYKILSTVDDSLSDKTPDELRQIISTYEKNPEDYPKPAICENNWPSGKVYCPKEDVTLFWYVSGGIRNYVDIHKGNV